MVTGPAELGAFGFAGLDRDRRLAAVGGELPAAGVAIAAVADLGDHRRRTQDRVRSDEQRAERGTVGVIVDRLADLGG